MYIIIDYFEDPVTVKTEEELAYILNEMPLVGSFYIFCFADETREFLPQISVYAKEGMFVIYHISMENGVITTLAAHNADMDDTETVIFSTNAQGDDVWFPVSWIKTSAELKECVTEFFKVKDRPPKCFEWKFIGKTDEGH